MSQLLAVAGSVQRRKDRDRHRQRAAAPEDAQHIGDARLLVKPAELRTRVAIIDGYRAYLDVPGREVRRFEQGGAERQQIGAGSGGALREDGHWLGSVERP